MARRALLLGIPDYDDPNLQIPAAKNDVLDLAKALRFIGFPERQIVPQAHGLTTSRMRSAIGKLFEAADAGDDLLLYFSGHGVVFEGKRLLVPIDFDPMRPLTVREMLSDLDIYALARGSRAASIVVFVDSCRAGVRLELVATTGAKALQDLGAGIEPETPTIAIVHSCEDDAESYFDQGEEGRSHFTAALREVLIDEQGPASLEGILFGVMTLLERRGMGQMPKLGENTAGRAGEPHHVLVKEDATARIRQRVRDSVWCAQLRELALFARVEDSPALQHQLEVIVLRCEEAARRAAGKLTEHGWRPENPIQRVLRRLPLLSSELANGSLLSAPEAALLLVAPHVYEAVLALAELELTNEGDPLAPDADANLGGYMVRAWRTAFFGDERWRRRRELVQQRDPRYARDVAAWQLLKFLHQSGELWQIVKNASNRRVWLGDALELTLGPAPFADVAADPRVIQVLNPERLVRLARFLFCSYADVQLAYGTSRAAQPARFHVGESTKQWEVDELKVAHLLSLLGRMAGDARRLPDSPAEHVGVDAAVDATAIRDALDGIEWHRTTEGRLSLSLKCFHQALDYALEQEVAALDEHLRRLHERFEGDEDWVAALPTHAEGGGLMPQRREGRPAYDRPHVRLQLDPERIRQLLMGPRLYGDPRYALREAYQNALDACRYRRARHDYLSRVGIGEPGLYTPRITIRTSTSESGRPFVECEDNGIGMERRHIEGLFALAGRRFADSHEFHLEKAAWDEAGVPFWSNSRFGIGVLAYFMLADEVVVWTRRMSDSYQGPTERCLVIRILSGSELFRVNEELGACAAGGTRVRLYLDGRPKEMQGTSLLDSVTGWLALPEVEVQLVDEGRVRQTLCAGCLDVSCIQELDAMNAVFPVGETDLLGQDQMFCVLRKRVALRPEFVSEGRRLAEEAPARPELLPVADGICVEGASSQDQRPLIIVNLKGDIAPALSVDRNTILSWEQGKTWAREQLRESLFTSAARSQNITIADLGTLARYFPLEAAVFNQALSLGEVEDRSLPFSSSDSLELRLQELGVSQRDPNVAHLVAISKKRESDVRNPDEPFLQYARGTPALQRSLWDRFASDAVLARLAMLRRARWSPIGALGSLATFVASHDRWTHLGEEIRDIPESLFPLQWSPRAVGAPTGRVSLTQLISKAVDWEVSLGEVLEIAHPLAALGIELPHADANVPFLPT